MTNVIGDSLSDIYTIYFVGIPRLQSHNSHEVNSDQLARFRDSQKSVCDCFVYPCHALNKITCARKNISYVTFQTNLIDFKE